MRFCTECRFMKGLNEFYHTGRPPVYSWDCKQCAKDKGAVRATLYRERNAKSPPMSGWCRDCKKLLPASEFYPNPGVATGLNNRCKPCEANLNRINSRKHRERLKKAGLCSCGKAPVVTGWKKCARCKANNLEAMRRYNASIRGDTAVRRARNVRQQMKNRSERLQMLERYGNQCKCCEEDNVYFLNFDHVDRDGHAQREMSRKQNIIRWIKARGYPDSIQILCYNCNIGRESNGGICPHLIEVPVLQEDESRPLND